MVPMTALVAVSTTDTLSEAKFATYASIANAAGADASSTSNDAAASAAVSTQRGVLSLRSIFPVHSPAVGAGLCYGAPHTRRLPVTRTYADLRDRVNGVPPPFHPHPAGYATGAPTSRLPKLGLGLKSRELSVHRLRVLARIVPRLAGGSSAL